MGENTEIEKVNSGRGWVEDGPDAEEIAEVVIECVRKHCYDDMSAFKVAEIGRETRFLEDLGFDGMDIADMTVDLEEELRQMPPYREVRIDVEYDEEIETVGDLIDMAQRAMGVKE